MSTNFVQCLVCEVGLPAPLTKSVEGNPYEAGNNLPAEVKVNGGSFFENPMVSITDLPTTDGFVGIDPEIIISDLMENLKVGGKVRW